MTPPLGAGSFTISVYIKDTQAMELPLVSAGGAYTIHDWNYLLSTLGLLRLDHARGNAVYLLGILVISASVVLGFYLSIESWCVLDIPWVSVLIRAREDAAADAKKSPRSFTERGLH